MGRTRRRSVVLWREVGQAAEGVSIVLVLGVLMEAAVAVEREEWRLEAEEEER